MAQNYEITYKYDSRGRLVSATDQAQKSNLYGYDDAGNRIATADESASLEPRPIISSFDGPSLVNAGTRVTLRWASTGTTHCKIDGDVSYTDLLTVGSVSFVVNGNIGLLLTCSYGDEKDTASKLIRVISSGSNPYN
ncbi:RHS repeat domain-containing protein [Alteromonas sp. 1_MG-2023]|uniref:RHS repeat domain-containing protein n=1 Tax=Alteromonas sp. 1_MG-2023 TaxID=3062669 RepID=UPI0026E453D4|nr:RHS repeat domain-containing protein [Alteromonas sp. 1_MG-2023]MDO6566261.1 RHS repeat domain-containing protein [Alteromonas sp. 1_MG-2023]